MTTNHTGVRRFVSGVGALALATGVLILGGSPALAAPIPGNIDPDASGSIIVHKHEHQTGSTPVSASPDGSTEITTAAVDGVTFTVYQLLHNGVAVGLSESTAWDGLGALTVNAACSAVTGGTGYTIGSSVGSGKTDGNGEATIAVARIGAYVVCETSAPETVSDTAAPFIVTVPFPFGDGWLYEVNVYPKNAVTSVTKSINAQQGLGLGSLVEFPVTVRIPAMAAGNEFTSFDVSDTFDSRLTPAAASSGTAVGVKSVTAAGTTLTTPGDYTVVPNGQTVVVSLNVASATVKALLTNNPNANVVVTFQAAVTGPDTGEISNKATAFVNNPADNEGNRQRPGVDSPPVTTSWGDIKILKTDSTSAANPLEGAEFQVFAAVNPYPDTAAECTSAVATGSALSVGGKTTFTSDEDGVVVIPGLFVKDSVNGPLAKQFRCYVVVETKAPAGYIKPTDPNDRWGIDVVTGATVINEDGTGYDQKVANVQQSGVTLPLTGAGGTLVMTITGLGLVGLGAIAIVVSRRRQRVAA